MDTRPSKRPRVEHTPGALALRKQRMLTIMPGGARHSEMAQKEDKFRAYQRLALALTLRRHTIPDDLSRAVMNHTDALYAEYDAWKQHRDECYEEMYKLRILFDNVQALNPTAQRAVVRGHVFRKDLVFRGLGAVIPRLTPADASCFHPVVCTPDDKQKRVRRIKAGEAPEHFCKHTWTDCAGHMYMETWHCVKCCNP